MSKPLEGIRVLEVAAWTFVPAAGAILADLGADVIKVEPPAGDPQRGLKNMLNLEGQGPNPFNEIPNRGKRSITLDLKNPAGRDLLIEIAKKSDVFLTSYLPTIREKLQIDVEDIRAVNPKIIYVRGSGWGHHGPMRDTGGYDLAAAWATSGMAQHVMRDTDGPMPMPSAFFDLQGSNTIAGAIGMALFKRERTGEAPIVDVPLMNVGLWTMAPGIVSAPYVSESRAMVRTAPGNPITNWYETRDGRWIYLVMLQGDRFWPEVCRVLEREDLIEDPRFATAALRFENRSECVAELDAIFAERPLEEWLEKLQALTGVWAPAINYQEIHEHRQVDPNGYLPTVTGHDGVDFKLVAPAMHFDETPTAPQGPAPELGQDTETVLMDIGLDWDAISSFRDRGGLG